MTWFGVATAARVRPQTSNTRSARRSWEKQVVAVMIGTPSARLRGNRR
jgi:hypothetical protein